MKVIVFGAGVYGRKYCHEANNQIEILAISDNNSHLHGKSISGHLIIPPHEILTYHFDKIIIAISDRTESSWKIIEQIISQLKDIGIPLAKIGLTTEYSYRDARVDFLRKLSFELDNVSGSVAECGVFRGWFASYINEFFPDRSLYLFDSFAGFSERDIEKEKDSDVIQWFDIGFNRAFQRGCETAALMRMPYPEKVIIKKGFVPETFEDIQNECFAFVNIDMDLYKPQLDALTFFAPRMTAGGVILVHDYYDHYLSSGVKKAVDEISLRYSITRIPVGDNSSVAIVIRA